MSPSGGRLLVLVPVLALGLVTGCGAGSSGGSSGGSPAGAGPGGLDVVATLQPVQWVAQRVAGDSAQVSNLVTSGADAHSLDLTPAQVAHVQEADVVLHLPDLQPATDGAVELRGPEGVVDVTQVVDGELDGDPHLWLDPVLMADLADLVAQGLADADPAVSEGVRARAEEVRAELLALDAELEQQLAGCRGAVLVTAHEAFGFLADRYGLEQQGVAGIDPHVEPTPARLREVSQLVEETGVRTIFFEASASTGVAQVLADDLGVRTGVLSTLESAPEGTDYLEVMRANGQALAGGLVCQG